jgi:mono/diheme cytochrome c family protein
MNLLRTCWAILLVLAFAASARAEETVSSWTNFTPRGNESASAQIRRGEEAYKARCNLCHGRIEQGASPGFGTRMSGTEALAAKYGNKKPAVLEDRTDLTVEVVKFFVRHGSGIMPFFRKTEVSDADLDAMAAYLTRKGRDRAKR